MKIFRLQESKTTLLKKLLNNGNITEEQFHTADDFFKRHNAFEKEIDWNRGLKITWEDLSEVIYKDRSSKSQTKKRIRKGLEGFEEGKDYLVLREGTYLGNPWVAYQPLTWEASRMIASHYVEPTEGYKGDLDAGWCTAYQKTRTYWDDYNEQEAFIYLCGETIPTKKVAISIGEKEYDVMEEEFSYSTGSLNYNIWDFEDYSDSIEDEEIRGIIPNLDELIERAYKNWDNTFNTVDLKYNPKTGRYDYDGSLSRKGLKKYLKPNKDGFTINFGKISGDFNCSYSQLTSLEGAPKEVGGDFSCSENQLTSLKGAPKEVGGNFDCSESQLTSLEGAPKKVGRDFDCHYNGLTSLKGAPKEVGGEFNCAENQLTSLEGAPKEVGGHFDCSENQLTSLEGAPEKVGGSFDCACNQLTSLKGRPIEVGRDFYCHYNRLTSLKGAPQYVGGWFNCSDNQLTSLEGAPQYVDGRFDCSENQLTSLEGAPIEVSDAFICSDNQLTSLEGAPEYVGGWFNCTRNPNLHSLEGIGEVEGEINKDF